MSMGKSRIRSLSIQGALGAHIYTWDNERLTSVLTSTLMMMTRNCHPIDSITWNVDDFFPVAPKHLKKVTRRWWRNINGLCWAEELFREYTDHYTWIHSLNRLIHQIEAIWTWNSKSYLDNSHKSVIRSSGFIIIPNISNNPSFHKP